MFGTLFCVLFASSALAAPSVPPPTRVFGAKRATCTVSSVSTASDLSDCSSVVIEGFTVPDGDTLTIEPASGATVTMSGELTFASTTASGPLLTIAGTSITFNGNGQTINGNGADYWDGEGTDGGKTKPHPFVKVKASGTVKDFTVLNSPAQAISVGNDAALTISSVTVDNSAGASLGANTDGFDVSASDVTITGCTVTNQDDCLAINSGSSIVFSNNKCSGGHGISIGSIATGKSVSGVTISGNTVTDSQNGLRIKVDADATDASVSDVTYTSNTVSGITEYGILITESYPSSDGTPGTGASITDINFTGGTTTVSVDSSAYRVVVDCGSDACSGTWDWDDLKATGGEGDKISAASATIEGGSY